MTATHVSNISRLIEIVRIYGCVQLHRQLTESLKTCLALDQTEKGGPTSRKAYLMTKILHVGRDSALSLYNTLSLLFHGHYISSTSSIKGYIYPIKSPQAQHPTALISACMHPKLQDQIRVLYPTPRRRHA